MEGRKSPEVVNLLRKLWDEDEASWGDVLDCGAAVQDLSNHPGWVWIDRILTELHRRTMHSLTVKPKREPTEYAQMLGFANALSAAPDIVATVLDEVGRQRAQASANAARQAAGVG